MTRQKNSLTVLVFAAILFAILPAPASTQTIVGTYKGANIEKVGNYVMAFPNDGKSTHPLVLFNAPYTVRNEDAWWVARVGSTAGMYPDVGLPENKRFYPCNGGDCTIYVVPVVTNYSLSNLGNVFGEIPGNTLLDRFFDEGYAVAVLLNGHYLGNDALSLILEEQQTVLSLGNNPRVERLVIVGMSQGGQLGIHSLTFPPGVPGGVASSDPRLLKVLAGVVSLGGWMELTEMWDFAKKNPAFFNPYKSRLAASFGMNPATWGMVTYDSLASRFHTPLLMIHGTDDCLVPPRQVEGFFSAIKGLGGSVNKWVYENGPCIENLPIASLTHGKLDQGVNPETGGLWATKQMTVIENFIHAKMPLGKDVPRNGDSLPAMLDELAKAYVMAPSSADQANVLDLIAQASNSRIKYTSSNPLLSGAGDKVVPSLWGEYLKVWQARIVVRRVPDDIDIPSLFRGYVLEYFLPWTTGARRNWIVATVTALANPTVIYVSVDPNFPSGRGDIFIRKASDRALLEFFTAYRNR